MRRFNIENYKCSNEVLRYWIKLLNTDYLVRESNRIDSVIDNIFQFSKPLNSKKKK